MTGHGGCLSRFKALIARNLGRLYAACADSNCMTVKELARFEFEVRITIEVMMKA